MIARLHALLIDDTGAVLAEYGVVVATFAIAGIAGLTLVSNAATNVLSNTFTNVTNLANCPPGSLGC